MGSSTTLDELRAAAWKNIPIIVAELTKILPAEKMADFFIPDANIRMNQQHSQVEARIFELACNVTKAMYASKAYSNYHVWEAFRHDKSKEAARAIAPDLIASLHPFGNCLTMSFECAEELRAKLKAEGPEYAGYADRVQFVTNNWEQQARSSREYHCIAIVRLPTQCIVMDAVNCSTAFAVPLGQLYAPPNCLSIGYFYVACGDARLLVECGTKSPSYTLARPYSRGKFEYDDPYAEIKDGLVGGVQNLAFPSVDYHSRGKLPGRRTAFVHQVWNHKPDNLCSELLPDKRYAIETCLLRVDSVKRKIVVEFIPYADWLLRPENADLLGRLRLRGRDEVRLPKNWGKFASIKLVLKGQGTDGFDEETVQILRLMDEVCGKLGMPEGEVSRIAGVMQEVWAEYDEAKAKKASCQQKGVPTRKERAAAKVTTQPSPREDGNVELPQNTDKRQVPY